MDLLTVHRLICQRASDIAAEYSLHPLVVRKRLPVAIQRIITEVNTALTEAQSDCEYINFLKYLKKLQSDFRGVQNLTVGQQMFEARNVQRGARMLRQV